MVPAALCLLICLFDFNGTAPIAVVQGLEDGAAPPSEVADQPCYLPCRDNLFVRLYFIIGPMPAILVQHLHISACFMAII